MISSSSVAIDHSERALTPLAAVMPRPRRRLGGHRVFAILLAALALAPAAIILAYAHSLNRNVPYYDEIDSAVALLVRLDAGVGPADFLHEMLAVTNEHRTVTSRLLFALSYALTGTVNFVWIGIIGNACIVLACALLLRVAENAFARVRLGVVLGLLLFHLGNYESFFWSGSSIDHFQVVALAIAACVGLQARTTLHTGFAVLAAVLATFTLAHGLVAWPVGAALLARDRRWRELAGWSLVALAAAAVFFAGFQINPGHRIGSHGLAAAQIVAAYWLQVLGAPLAFGHVMVARLLGAALVLATVARTCRGDWTRQRAQLPILWFVIGGTLLIAVGRAELSDGAIASRYLILGGFGWALLLWDGLERLVPPGRPFVAIGSALPLLLAFNVAQNLRHHGDALTFVEHRDRAALRYRQYGADGRAPVSLHPLPEHATEILVSAEERGVYRIPLLCERREFPDARSSGRIAYHLDEFTLNDRAAYFAGWAAIPGHASHRGQVHLVLRSPTATHVFTTIPIRRPDVVSALDRPEWLHCGFRATLRRSRLDPASYQIGFLLTGGDEPEYILTDHRLDLAGDGAVTFQQ